MSPPVKPAGRAGQSITEKTMACRSLKDKESEEKSRAVEEFCLDSLKRAGSETKVLPPLGVSHIDEHAIEYMGHFLRTGVDFDLWEIGWVLAL